MTDRTTDQIRDVAGILATADPATWRRLLDEHTASPTGHCLSCTSSAGASPAWPCSLWAIGEEAERLSMQNDADAELLE